MINAGLFKGVPFSWSTAIECVLFYKIVRAAECLTLQTFQKMYWGWTLLYYLVTQICLAT